MILAQSIRMAVMSIVGNKVRSFLTMLGIVIGVSSVILLVSVGQGVTGQITSQFSDLGTNQLTVMITGRGAVTSLTAEEVAAFSRVPRVDQVSPTISSNVTAKYRNVHTNVSLEGITASYEKVQNFHVQSGRFLLDIDNEYRQKAALIGTETAKKLFGADNPVGREIQLNGTSFQIVGLLQAKGTSLSGSNDKKILIPLSTSERLLQSKGIQTFTVTALSDKDVASVKTAIGQILDRKFLRAKDAYSVFDSKQMLDTLKKTSGTLSLALAGIAGISLFVGGIGIMNIMIISVNERTREIGIRKAIGAKKIDILLQFIIESMVLSTMGGILGIGAGLGLTWLVGQLTALQVGYAWNMVNISFLFSLFIGVFFGILPASKAARLRPIQALRTD
ncbi:ABC transporter permease [Paenibacillus silagei]|uniref:ABC transport system permease protein n=1 Tax=Paenibacillus silagei TaxID=1670801 RepID=A0ABS4NSX6_9BACL|nr:ABC transporter permease [Paenibacillus silagei]MBP2113161.1 putative ABC transport system permease protein [Paenibacillus silagei]